MIRFLFLGLFLAGLARAEVPVPDLADPVVDLTGTLTLQQKQALGTKLLAFERKKGSQIGVLLVPSTRPEEIEQYGIRVAEKWKLGRNKVDDGAILIVAKDDRKLRIEVGYGLEGVLNDAVSKRIISEVIVPRFKADDFYGGIEAGIDKMMALAEGEALPEVRESGQSGSFDSLLTTAFVAAVVLGGFLRMLLGRFPAAVAVGSLVAVIAWFLAGTVMMALLAGFVSFFFTLMGVSGLMGMGGFRGGGGFDGGFRGGGGGFGGGGASGEW